MIRSTLLRSISAVIGAFLMASCSDSGVIDPGSEGALTPPGLTDAPRDVSGTALKALWWRDRLSSPVSVTQTIGVLGGTISIPQTGLTVSFPAGAVEAPIEITITADTEYVAYKMAPAGTQFLAPVTVTQSLPFTALDNRPLTAPVFVAYIADDNVSLTGNVPVKELEPAQTIFSLNAPLIPVAQVWIIRHFSRYMLASG